MIRRSEDDLEKTLLYTKVYFIFFKFVLLVVSLVKHLAYAVGLVLLCIVIVPQNAHYKAETKMLGLWTPSKTRTNSGAHYAR